MIDFAFYAFLLILTVGSIRTPFVSWRALLRIRARIASSPDPGFFMNLDPDPVSRYRSFDWKFEKIKNETKIIFFHKVFLLVTYCR